MLGSFDPSRPLAESHAPPANWYTDADLAAVERQTVFARNWLPICRTEELPSPGSYAARSLAGRPVVLSRDGSGRLHALANVCRHRAAEVAQGCATAEQFVCPYHGWTYALDGRLLRAPELGAVACFDRTAHALPKLPCDTWGRWHFAALEPPCWSLAPALRELAARLDAFGYQHLTHVATRQYELRCNWKVYVDNYLDGGYHVATLHRGLAGQLNLDDYRTELFDRWTLQSCTAREADLAETTSEAAGPSADFPQRLAGGALYAWVYPNWMLNRYGPILDTNVVWPLAADRCLVVFDFYFTEVLGTEAESFVARSIAASEIVQQEDIAICESVQRGLESGLYQPGPYSLLREAAQYRFHQLLAADLMGEPDACR